MTHTVTEENYIKAIHRLSGQDNSTVSTNQIAEAMQTAAASATDMIKRLSEKELVHYEKYKGVQLTETGSRLARLLLRRHRLWEVFLVEKLGFAWDEVHAIAEELEHIQSEELTSRLDEFLGSPSRDPHGDPIPDAEGNITYQKQTSLQEVRIGGEGVVVGVRDTSSAFLQYLDSIGISLGTRIQLARKVEYDNSMIVQLDGKREVSLSSQVSKNLFIRIG